ncbi:MAG: amidohydrolase family protein, partial [Rhodococcus fascians]
MADRFDLLIRAPRAIVDGWECAVSVGIRDGRIDSLDARHADDVVELSDDEVLLPGLVDTHVHVNEPGRTEWEGFASATRAARAGGITTIVDMPLNSIPPTVDVDALEIKRRVAADRSVVNVGFWGGAVPGNVDQLRPLHDAGAFGFKCFLLHSGVDEFPPLSAPELEKALIEIASFDGLMIVHAEDAGVISSAPPPSGTAYSGFLDSRPRAAENLAIAQVV